MESGNVPVNRKLNKSRETTLQKLTALQLHSIPFQESLQGFGDPEKFQYAPETTEGLFHDQSGPFVAMKKSFNAYSSLVGMFGALQAVWIPKNSHR